MRDLQRAALAAKKATNAAKELERSIENPKTRSRANILSEMRAADEAVVDQQKPRDMVLEMKLGVIVTLHKINKLTFSQIDKLLGWGPSTTANIVEDNPKEFRHAFRRAVDQVLDEFYRNKISILDNLMAGAVNTVQHLRELQQDPQATTDQRIKAGERIYDWTRLILTTKKPKAARDVLSPGLQEAADEADAVEGMLIDVLGGKLDDGEEN